MNGQDVLWLENEPDMVRTYLVKKRQKKTKEKLVLTKLRLKYNNGEDSRGSGPRKEVEDAACNLDIFGI